MIARWKRQRQGAKMLVLTRQQQQRTLIRVPGPDGKPVHVWITLIATERNKVRLGFEAPPEVLILREEVIERNNADWAK